MQNEKDFREQPEINSATAEQSADGTRAENLENGSLGKFKDTESLLSAYNNLQAEFTRKCQALSQLQKEADNVKDEQEQTVQPVTPVYLNDDWNEKVYAFLENNIEAKPYAKEISQLIMQDENLASSDDALSLAWSKIAIKNYKSPKDNLEDDDFIQNYVLKSEKVKQAVVNHLSQQIKNNNNPNLINSISGGSYGSVKIKTPTSLLEAKELARKFFD